MQNRKVIKGQTLRIPFKARWPNGNPIDLTTSGYSLNLYLKPDGASLQTYASGDSGRVVWTDQNDGEGYWLFSEAETASSLFPAGQVEAMTWFIDAASSPDQKFPLARKPAVYTVEAAPLGEDP